MEKFSHIVTEEDLAFCPEVFTEGVEVGASVLLSANDLVLLNVTSHVVNESDIVNNPGVTLEVGQVVAVPDVEGFSTLQREINLASTVSKEESEN